MSGLSEHEIGAFADVFPDPFSARHVLATAGVPTRRHPSWTATDAYGFWGAVSVLLTNGLVKDGPARLFAAAFGTVSGKPRVPCECRRPVGWPGHADAPRHDAVAPGLDHIQPDKS